MFRKQGLAPYDFRSAICTSGDRQVVEEAKSSVDAPPALFRGMLELFYWSLPGE